MTDQNQSNSPDLTTLGQEAIKALVSGNKSLSKANALFTYVIAQAWNRVFVATIYKAKSEDIESTDSFDLSDIINETNVRDAAGKRNNKLTKARLDAVASELFDVDSFDVSQTQTFKTCLSVVGAIFALDYAQSDIVLHERSKALGVPYVLMNDKPADDDLNALRDYNNNADSIHYLDGKQGNSFAELKRKVLPKSHRELNDNTQSDKAVTFRTSVKFVADITKQFNSEQESEVALNADDEKLMYDLYIKLGKYFEANKLDAKDIKKLKEVA